MLPYPVNKVNGKLQQPNPGTMPKGKDPSKMKVLFTLPGKETRFAEGGGNLEWVVKEVENQLRPLEQFQKTKL